MKKIMITVLSVFIFLYGCSEEVVIMESHKNMSDTQLINALNKIDQEYRDVISNKSDDDKYYKINSERNSLINEAHNRNLFKNMDTQQVRDLFDERGLAENCTKVLYQPYEGSVCEYSTIFEYGAIFIYTDKNGKVLGSKTFNY